MADASSPTVGSKLTVSITETDGELVVRSDARYDVELLGSPPGDLGTREQLTVSVESTWYSTDGSLQTLFVTSVDESGGGSFESDATETGTRQPATADDGDSGGGGGSSAPNSLHEIAAELIVDREFVETPDEDSLVGAAKHRASDRGRDPAIDPRLQDPE